ncbi:MAG: hypothetical protein AAF356_07300 [Planctomycetota bacterium]
MLQSPTNEPGTRPEDPGLPQTPRQPEPDEAHETHEAHDAAEAHADEPARGWWCAPLLIGLLAIAAAWPLIFAGNLNGRGAGDHLRYHEPAIFTFASDWPAVDLSDYLSATTPGYHLLMAYIAITPGSDREFVQLASSMFYVALLGLLSGAIAKRTGPMLGVALTLPLAASLHVYAAGVWLLPDNAGWLLVLTVLLLALTPRPGWRTLITVALAMAALVMMRQIHLWAAAALWASAWLNAAPVPAPAHPGAGIARDVRTLLSEPLKRARRTLPVFIATIPAFLIVGAFAAMWGGLTPPTFQEHYHGGNPAAPAFVLSLLAIFSLPHGALLVGVVRDAWDVSRGRVVTWALGAAALGLLVGALFPTTYDQDAGRWTGLWNIVRALPEWAAPGGRSLLIAAGAACGAVALTAWCASVPVRTRWVALTALAGFTAAQTASRELWQRYNEPFVLILLALLAAIALHTAPPGSRTARTPAWMLAAPALLLALAFAGVTALEIATAPPARSEPAQLKADELRTHLQERYEASNGVDDAPAAPAPTDE